MGLTGVIVQASLRTEPLVSPWVAADIDRTDSLEQTLALMGGAERHRYSVACALDFLLAGGSRMGRAIISRADPLGAADAAAPTRRGRATGAAYPDALSRRPAFEVPHGFPAALLRPASMRAFNALRWRATPRRERQRPLAMAPYFFPLDALGEWNRFYGPPAGLIQYQFVIPTGEERTLGTLLPADPHTATAGCISRCSSASAPRSGVRCHSRSRAGRSRSISPRPRPAWERRWTSSTSWWPAVAVGCTWTKDASSAPRHTARDVPATRSLPHTACSGRSRRCPALRPRSAPGTLRSHPVSTGSAGRRVMVLGGTSEIALEIVRELQRQEPREAVLVGRNPSALSAAADNLREAGCSRVGTRTLDALDVGQHEEALGQAFDELGGADIVILAVGVLGRRGGLPADVADALQTMRIDFVGAGSLLIYTARRLREKGNGTIVVLSSAAVERPRQRKRSSTAGLQGRPRCPRPRPRRRSARAWRARAGRASRLRSHPNDARPGPRATGDHATSRRRHRGRRGSTAEHTQSWAPRTCAGLCSRCACFPARSSAGSPNERDTPGEPERPRLPCGLHPGRHLPAARSPPRGAPPQPARPPRPRTRPDRGARTAARLARPGDDRRHRAHRARYLRAVGSTGGPPPTARATTSAFLSSPSHNRYADQADCHAAVMVAGE